MRVGGLAGPNAPGPRHDSRNACATQHAARKIRSRPRPAIGPGPREGREGAGAGDCCRRTAHRRPAGRAPVAARGRV